MVRPCLVHENSLTLCYVDSRGCQVVDLIQCALQLQCSATHPAPAPAETLVMPTVRRGTRAEVSCRMCHAKLAFRMQNIHISHIGGVAVKADPSLDSAVGGLEAQLERHRKHNKGLLPSRTRTLQRRRRCLSLPPMALASAAHAHTCCQSHAARPRRELHPTRMQRVPRADQVS